MLVLSRKTNERIYVGDDITITVIEVKGDKVRIGIEAPKDVSVDRQEVRECKEHAANFRQRERLEANQGNAIRGDEDGMDAEAWAELNRWKRELPQAIPQEFDLGEPVG